MQIKEKYIPVFKKIVREISELSTCAFRKVGAIIVKDNRIVAEGYNGAPSGMIECQEVDKLIDGKLTKEKLAEKYGIEPVFKIVQEIEKIKETDLYSIRIAKYGGAPEMVKKILNPVHNIYEIHAEMNAITQCAKFGIDINGASIVCTHLPCLDCAKAIVGAGIKEVYYIEEYKDSKNNYKDSKLFFELNNVKVFKI